MFKNRALILAKKEASYGVDPVPTTALNAILTDLPEVEVVMKKLDRLNVKAFLGNRPAISIGEAIKVSFSTEVKGSGDATPDTPPEIGVLFVGCGMLETVTPTTGPVVYSPQDDIEGPSITIYFWQHDIQYVVTGCRGTWSLDGKAGEFGKIKWEFQGLYAGPADLSIPTDAVYNASIPPALKSGLFTLGSFAGTIESFKLTYGNEIAKRPDVNAATGFLAHFIKERKVTAEIDPEAPALSLFNPLTLLTGGTEQALSITFGETAGNRMKLDCPKVVIDSTKFGEREGILTHAVTLLVCPDAGEDDVTVTFN
jgi:hypothetical protein